MKLLEKVCEMCALCWRCLENAAFRPGPALAIVAEAGFGFVLLADQRTVLHSYRDVHRMEMTVHGGKKPSQPKQNVLVLCPFHEHEPGWCPARAVLGVLGFSSPHVYAHRSIADTERCEERPAASRAPGVAELHAGQRLFELFATAS